MKFKTNVNIFGVGAGHEFDSDLTEFLSAHVDSGLLTVLPGGEDPGDTESGSESGPEQADGAGGQPPAADAAESVSAPVKKSRSRRGSPGQ